MDNGTLALLRERMTSEGVEPTAVETFCHHVQSLRAGETGMVPESTIDPHDVPALEKQPWPEGTPTEALANTAVIKLNGGLGTSMGLDRAKSLLKARGELTFLDVIARQVLALRRNHGVRLPLIFLSSFRTSADSLASLAPYPDLAIDDLPLELLQNRVPKLRADDLTPVQWPEDPDLEWCPPGHGDLYAVLYATGLVDKLRGAGFTQAFVSNSDNLGALPDPQVAAWFAQSGAPFAIEAVRRTSSDRKGGHFARRKRDQRIVLRETAQTMPEDGGALADLGRHRFASTNNLWFDLEAMGAMLRARSGVLDLPLIRNLKTVDPADPASPPVIQLETAMGAAIELFDEARTVAVGRERFVPVKTTDDLLVLRSDYYRLDADQALHLVGPQLPFVALGPCYKTIAGFEQRFPHGPPSLVNARSLVIRGDWVFGHGVRILGDVELGPEGGTVASGAVLGEDQR